MFRPLVFVLFVLAAAALSFWLDAQGWLSIEFLQGELGRLKELARQYPVGASVVYAATYIVVTALSVPATATLMTLLAGAVFGIVHGTVLVSFASTIGATVACAIARYLLRAPVERRFGTLAAAVNSGIATDGGYYLFAIRLMAIFPFFVVNLVMGITRLPLTTYYVASQLGMLPATLIYVNAGTQLARVNSLSDIISPGLLGSLVLLGIFPFIVRYVLDRVRGRRPAAGPGA